MFREGADFTVLDRSRGEWGEAADDVSAMTINYLFFGLLKTDGNEIDKEFKQLYETFFEVYLDKSGEYELLEVIPPFYALCARNGKITCTAHSGCFWPLGAVSG